MDKAHEIIIAGFGGQGVLSMGQIIGYASMIEGKDGVLVWHECVILYVDILETNKQINRLLCRMRFASVTTTDGPSVYSALYKPSPK